MLLGVAVPKEMTMMVPDWDDLRVFLAVARTGRLSVAAQQLQFDHSTIARRIDRLEKALDAKIFDRSPVGVKLTSHGVLMLSHAERIEAEMLEITEGLNSEFIKPAGHVRLAAPEAFGSCFIAIKADLLHKLYPDIQLELIPNTQFVSLSKREADIVITANLPPKGRLKVRKLCDCSLGLYASESYVTTHGIPHAVEELADHAFVRCSEDQLQRAEFQPLNQFLAEARIVFRSRSVVARQNAVAAGLGIGLIHTFLAEEDPRLVRILPDIVVHRPYWLLFHADRQRVPRIRAVVSFLNELVKSNRQALAVTSKSTSEGVTVPRRSKAPRTNDHADVNTIETRRPV
jgi:DNA-binding transcriptional LysR family regulator